MRYRQEYTLHPVQKNDGRTVYYYRTYDENGKRTSGKSTGQTSKAAAHTYMKRLIQEGRLAKGRDITFSEYAQDWWVWDKCAYIRTTLATGGRLTRDYADIAKGYLTQHIVPTFGDYKLTDITARHIEEWRVHLREKKHLAAKTINNEYAVFRKMMNEAERLDYIRRNPTRKVKSLLETQKKRTCLTAKEAKDLFATDKWTNPISYAANLLAATTGMRLGEIVALKSEYVYDDHVWVGYSYSRKYGLKETKTHDVRDIPIPKITAACLSKLKAKNESGFIFYKDGGQTPFYYRAITDDLYSALKKIKIDETKRTDRNLTFHSWRHFFNTMMRGRGVSDSKLQRLTGHKTQSMTEHYTHFRLEDFSDVAKVQESMFKDEEQGSEKGKPPK